MCIWIWLSHEIPRREDKEATWTPRREGMRTHTTKRAFSIKRIDIDSIAFKRLQKLKMKWNKCVGTNKNSQKAMNGAVRWCGDEITAVVVRDCVVAVTITNFSELLVFSVFCDSKRDTVYCTPGNTHNCKNNRHYNWTPVRCSSSRISHFWCLCVFISFLLKRPQPGAQPLYLALARAHVRTWNTCEHLWMCVCMRSLAYTSFVAPAQQLNSLFSNRFVWKWLQLLFGPRLNRTQIIFGRPIFIRIDSRLPIEIEARSFNRIKGAHN